ncbi:transmembrane protein 208-like [Babylonia areolata]|uniref:transmembrane protein 208-like n=1 Tax=Babylonia areolata TaxID=304850 RepID=UPI003FD4BB84
MPPKGKQGTRGQKQIVEENKSTLVFYRNILLAVNVLYFTVYFIFFWDNFTTLPVMMTLTAVSMSVGSYHFMNSMAQPTYNQGTLVDSGIDLNMEAGMAEHAPEDIILLTTIVQSLSLISNYFWLFLLLAPARAFYMLWVNVLGPWFFAEAPEQPVDDKKAKKLERKMKRLQR